MKRFFFLAILSVALLVGMISFAAIPGTVSYQGLYTDNGGPVNGQFSFTFSLFDALSSGTEVWTETKNLDVTDGIFNTQLGDVTALPVTLFKNGATYWLEVTVGSTTLTPRVEFNHYSGKAAYADTAMVALSGTGGNELWSTDDTNVWRINGSVGIGTETPASKLDVAGAVQSTGFKMPTGASNGFILTSDASGVGTWQSVAGGGNISGSGTVGYLSKFTGSTAIGNSVISETGGNIGIGTTSPSQKLDVNGSVRLADLYGGETNGVLAIVAQRSQATPGAALRLYTNDGADASTLRMEFTGGVTTSVINVLNSRMAVSEDVVSSTTPVLLVANTGNGRAIYASSNATQNTRAAIYGDALADGGVGVYGHTNSLGVASGASVGVFGHGENDGASTGGATLGILGRVESYQTPGHSVPVGVFGEAMSTSGIAWGIAGETWSLSSGAAGVKGTLKSNGVTGRAIWGDARPSANPSAYAGWFDGKIHVAGTLSKTAGSFKIDHPLNPENKYLSHSFVESPDMMNVYNGNVVLNGSGEATVMLPNWFESLNKDFRYQLTAIGSPGPSLYISREVQGNNFSIAGGSPGLKVSWQITGIRHDPYADAHRIQVEEEKPTHEKGKLLHPTEYGYPTEQRIE